MKKILAFALIVSALTSCKKDALINSTSSIPMSNEVNYTSKNNRIAFNSVADYDNLGNMEDLKLQQTILDKISSLKASSAVQKTEADDPIVDSIRSEIPFLDVVLNEDEIVQIQDEIVKLDFVNEKVYLMKESNENDITYAKLSSGEADGTIIKEYSMTTEILDVIAGTDGTDGTADSWFCGESGVGESQVSSGLFEVPLGYCSNTKYIEARSQYQKLGIYFRLFADAYLLKTIRGVQPQISDFHVQTYRKYKPKCQSEIGLASLIYNSNSSTSYICGDNASSNIRVFAYNGTRGLNKLYLETRTYMTISGVTYVTTNPAIISKNY